MPVLRKLGHDQRQGELGDERPLLRPDIETEAVSQPVEHGQAHEGGEGRYEQPYRPPDGHQVAQVRAEIALGVEPRLVARKKALESEYDETRQEDQEPDAFVEG